MRAQKLLATDKNIKDSTIFNQLKTIRARDPAARYWLEIVFLYPSFHAVIFYRIAHFFWWVGLKFIARALSQFARLLSGIEIHPAAKIGNSFFIDHGMGVVIGETAEIGNHVTLYHGVTLGGVSPAINSDSQRAMKRHPTIKDGVIIGANAQILGAVTVGENCLIGSGAIVTKNIPPNVTVVGNPARIVGHEGCGKEFSAYGIPQGELPDIIANSLKQLQDEVKSLRAELAKIKKK